MSETTVKPARKFKMRTWAIYTYDVWGNARDGFEVNNVFGPNGRITVKCRREVFNAGTPHEFETFEPTDRQLAVALGATGFEFECSDDLSPINFNLKRNGKPIGELREINPDSDD